MTEARISIVMAVFNGAATVQATAASLLAQSERRVELIIVDDGSSDETPDILARIAREDTRVRIVTQAHEGLTRALVRGCSEATAPLIARHDCGDWSEPDRLRRQADVMDGDPEVVLVSCSTSFHAPGGEQMYVADGEGDAVRQSLLHAGLQSIRGLSHHGSAMFRRRAYLAAGGYRVQFRFAQDLDLWIRMAKLGKVEFVPEILYHARFDVAGISGRYRPQQIESTRIALALRDRGQGQSEEHLLDMAATIAPAARKSGRAADARALYFIASCLRRRGERTWSDYARRAIRSNPFHLRTWLLFVRRPR